MSDKTQKDGDSKSVVPIVGSNVVSLPELSDIFSEWTIRGIKNWKTVEQIGANNIKKLLSYLRNSEGSSSGRIKELYEKRKTLDGASAKDFIKKSKEYDGLPNPFPEKGERANNWSGDLEPLGVESETRKHDSSSYTLCGWCKHSSGTGRFGYTISGSCNFFNEQEKIGFDCKWDSPCFMKTLSEIDFKEMVENIDLKIEEEKVKRESIRIAISKMQSILDTVNEDKPYLMSLRPHDYFNVGDRMKIYMRHFKDHIADGDWISASCIFGYRHHDGCVSYQTDYPIHTNLSYYEGRGGGVGSSRPEAIKESDFEYFCKAFKEDNDFLYIWYVNAVRGSGYEEWEHHQAQYDYIHQFENPSIAKAPKDWTPPTDEIEILSVENALDLLTLFQEPKTKKDLNDWVKFQLQYVHPDKFSKDNKAMQEYSHRQTRAIYAAKELLQVRLDRKNSKK
jgi:hypothetical protein